jgi:hypothetical protein
MEIETHWHVVKKIFKNSFASSFHFSIASVDQNHKPHVTPIGSLILGKPGHAIYFEEFTNQLKINIQANNHICVLAVNSSKWFWLKSLILGHFSEPPAIRLSGKSGILRKATSAEIKIWKMRVKLVSLTKGHKIMWRQMGMVREVIFSEIHPVHISTMTTNIKS